MPDYYQKYLKYKKKYLLEKSKLSQEGGGKRTVHSVSEEDIVIANPIGSPTMMNRFLLGPEVDFIYGKCSKNKSFAKQCSKENITDLLTYIINIEQTHGDFNREVTNLIKFSKLSKDFVNQIIKNHKEFEKKNLV